MLHLAVDQAAAVMTAAVQAAAEVKAVAATNSNWCLQRK
jgi:hypothetical protein